MADISENIVGEFTHTDLWQSVSYMLLVWIIHEPVLYAFGHYLTLQTCQLFALLITVMSCTLPASLLIWQLKACFTTLPPISRITARGVCLEREREIIKINVSWVNVVRFDLEWELYQSLNRNVICHCSACAYSAWVRQTINRKEIVSSRDERKSEGVQKKNKCRVLWNNNSLLNFTPKFKNYCPWRILGMCKVLTLTFFIVRPPYSE